MSDLLKKIKRNTLLLFHSQKTSDLLKKLMSEFQNPAFKADGHHPRYSKNFKFKTSSHRGEADNI